MLTVWGRANSVNVMKVLWTCQELELRFERVDAGMEYGGLDAPELLAANPNGRVPAINDDGYYLFESNVIVRYLSYKYGLGGMYPSDMRHRATAEQWMEWQQTTLAPPLAWMFHGLVRNNPAYANEFKMAQAAGELNRAWRILDAYLEGRDYVLGNTFTMADVPLGVAAWRWFQLPFERIEVPHVTTWHSRLLQRPGFKQYVAHSL